MSILLQILDTKLLPRAEAVQFAADKWAIQQLCMQWLRNMLRSNQKQLELVLPTPFGGLDRLSCAVASEIHALADEIQLCHVCPCHSVPTNSSPDTGALPSQCNAVSYHDKASTFYLDKAATLYHGKAGTLYQNAGAWKSSSGFAGFQVCTISGAPVPAAQCSLSKSYAQLGSHCVQLPPDMLSKLVRDHSHDAWMPLQVLHAVKVQRSSLCRKIPTHQLPCSFCQCSSTVLLPDNLPEW